MNESSLKRCLALSLGIAAPSLFLVGGHAAPDRIHRATSADGTQIVGRVYGDGPALVFVHGGLGDGETSWRSLLPLLSDSFTCYLMSIRGRGLSAEPGEPDYSLDRLVEDVTAFAESVGEPVGLLGYSFGGTLALGAAARSDAVSAVAVYEPAVFEAHGGDEDFAEALAARVRSAIEDGSLVDAARMAIEGVALEDELTALEASGAFELWARNVPIAVQDIEQAGRSPGPGPTAPPTLARVTARVLYLHGALTPTRWYRDGGDHVAAHAADVRIREVPEVGHFSPILVPEAIADELIRFFEATVGRAGR
jgi:pimeloyl-ACP methyl ester carboxylesterase